jgi:prepilin-type processing-associated H-X9-DG protein
MARRASCQSNLKNIGLGLMQYTQDYDETMPFAWYGTNTATDNGDNYKWMDATYPYTKNNRLFNCPSDIERPPYVHNDALLAGQTSTAYGSYVYNDAYTDGGQYCASPSGAALADVATDATVWVADGNGNFEFTWTKGANPGVVSGTPRYLQNISERHAQTVNVLYCDGHIKALKLDPLTAARSIADPANGNAPTDIMTAFTIQRD